MVQYSFKNLSEDLAVGREIEFEYNNMQYSITNSFGYWFLYCDTTKTELLKICRFEDKKTLVKKVSEYKINGTSIQRIFDTFLYNRKLLYVL